MSFRLGGADGVSVEARKWEWALRELGFETRRVAGEIEDTLRPDDTWLPFLAIDPVDGARPEPDALAAALSGADLVVVANLCSLPLNLDAATIAAEVLDHHEGRVLFHHHDLPWERPQLAHLTSFPPRRSNSLHIVINEHARIALAQRGIESEVIRNSFDLHPIAGDRRATRRAFEFADEDLVVLQPTRAIPRKEVGRGIRFAEALAAELPGATTRFWLTGPAEDGFDDELARLIASSRVSMTTGRAPRAEDAYAASDVVVFPSSWEGFGNPVIEATIADVPVAVARYPVLEELVDLGLRFLSIDDVPAVAQALRRPDPEIARSNHVVLERHLDLRTLPERLGAAFASVGWEQW